jgi:hypothetical protein
MHNNNFAIELSNAFMSQHNVRYLLMSVDREYYTTEQIQKRIRHYGVMLRNRQVKLVRSTNMISELKQENDSFLRTLTNDIPTAARERSGASLLMGRNDPRSRLRRSTMSADDTLQSWKSSAPSRLGSFVFDDIEAGAHDAQLDYGSSEVEYSCGDETAYDMMMRDSNYYNMNNQGEKQNYAAEGLLMFRRTNRPIYRSSKIMAEPTTTSNSPEYISHVRGAVLPSRLRARDGKRPNCH